MVDRYVNLLSSLPKPKRNVQARSDAKDPEVVRISKQFGWEYFDGDRKYGYGGFRYDGRWKSVAKDIIEFFNLKHNSRILDIGCAKGFLVTDLINEGMDAYGLDISPYAILGAFGGIRSRLQTGTAERLPYPDKSFDCVISINTIHNLSREGVIRALKEIERVSKGDKNYVVVDSYHTPEQKALFESWVLTAEYHDYPEGWLEVFKEAGYNGHYSWTIIE